MPANVSTMMYVGDEPWHKLGKRLEKAATSEEAIIAAGLNWKVSKQELFLGDKKKVPNRFAIVREDNNTPLGIVGNVYNPLQNKDAFRFFDSVVGCKEAMYHTAGALGAGEIIWILAKLPGYIRVIGDDVTEKFLLLTNRHDGTGTVQVLLTPIRVVCQNTLNAALSGNDVRAKIRHSTNIGYKIEEVRETLGIVNAQFAIMEEAAKKLAVTELTNDILKNYFKNVIGAREDDKGELSTRSQNVLDQLEALYHEGKGAEMKGVRGTAWGAYNAVVEYVDFYRNPKGEAEDRSKSILFGSGSLLKEKAWTQAMLIAQGK